MVEQLGNADDAHSLVGTRIDRYEVLRLIGAGAFGVVYEVRHTRLGKRFAMKVVHHELADLPQFVLRFEQEARACSCVQHPNCISVTDFGKTANGELFLVMEYVEGETLGELFDRGTISLGEAVDIGRQVLLGLEHAHAAGVIHRDIKLDNIMLVRSGEHRIVKILDFGIARVPVEQGGQLTQAGVIFGTPRYMAPEQAVSTQVDGRADVYAVGVVLWMLLTGAAPHDAPGHVELLQQKLSAPSPRLEVEFPGRFPAEIVAAINGALVKEPSLRHQSAKVMREALERAAEGMLDAGGARIARIASMTVDLPSDALRTDSTSRGKGALSRARGKLSAVGRSLWAGSTGGVRSLCAQSTSWYRCENVSPAPSWRIRLTSLWRTAPGRTTSLLLIVPTALVALAIGIGFAGRPTAALVTLPTRAHDGTTSTQARPAKPPGLSPEVEKRLVKARLFLAKRACSEAVFELQRLVAAHPKLAGGYYLLGAAQVCRGRYLLGLEAYRHAIAMDPRYRKDGRVAEDLQRIWRLRRHRQRAFDFAEQMLGKEGATPLLTKVASSARRRSVRQRALAILRKWDATDGVDWQSSLALDLAQMGSCKERKAVVAKLVLLGGAKALDTLQHALKARSGLFGLTHKHGCIERELRQAINTLERRR